MTTRFWAAKSFPALESLESLESLRCVALVFAVPGRVPAIRGAFGRVGDDLAIEGLVSGTVCGRLQQLHFKDVLLPASGRSKLKETYRRCRPLLVVFLEEKQRTDSQLE